MHEVSLGLSIRDYLTGENVEQTTYEDLRQALARMLVEELEYPSESLVPKVSVRFPVNGEEYCRTVDLAAHDVTGAPFFFLLFVPGQVNTFVRESLAAARLAAGGPVPLIAITDTRDALLLETATGTCLGEGMQALPRHKHALQLAAQNPVPELSADRILKERKILHTYSEFMKTCCDESLCML
ncbi:type I restriction endonuclease subunit R [Oleidesulfovibrio sp.]|uniref:type I restriction endonuclease subunit R n=1 Tax=Oleidesulfovibrio sp. TaxID=2909707 RepID=UPI003A841393